MTREEKQKRNEAQMKTEDDWHTWWRREQARFRRQRKSRVVTNLGDQFGDILRAARSGFTLVEVLVLVIILGIFLSIIVFGCDTLTGSADSEKVKTQAYTFVSELGYSEILGVSCSTHDSDGDGYISCSVRVKDGDMIEMIAIECAGGLAGYFKSGCRQPKIHINQNRN